MPYGLQAWDAAGKLVFDTNTMTIRMGASLVVTSNGSGNIDYVPSFGKAFYAIGYQVGVIGFTSLVKVSDTRFTWQTSSMSAGSMFIIIYGEI